MCRVFPSLTREQNLQKLLKNFLPGFVGVLRDSTHIAIINVLVRCNSQRELTIFHLNSLFVESRDVVQFSNLHVEMQG